MASSAGAATVNAEQQHRAPKWWRSWWVVIAIVVALVAGGILFATRPWETRPKTVAVQIVTPGPATRVLAVNGRIAALTDVQLGSTVAGRVKTVNVHEGDQVSLGEVMATLDDAQQQAATVQAKALLEASQAQLLQAQTNYDRARGLGDAIAQKDLQAAQVSLQTAKNDVDRLKAALDEAQSLLAAYTIVAPFRGTVLMRGIDPGQVISTSTSLFDLADLDHLEVTASVDELYAGDIHRGLVARLRPSGSNQTFEARVTFVSPQVDPTTGGREVRIALDQHGSNLPIGLTVDTNIIVDKRDDAITVPRAAVLDPRTRPAVFLLRNGEAVRTPIEFVDWPAGDLIVTQGLKKGDVLITNPAGISDHQKVAAMGQ